MKGSLFLVLVLISQVAYTQKISVKGQLTDSTQSALPSATVLILNPKDSSLINFGLTNQQGAFEVKNLMRQQYLFKVSYVGYRPMMLMFSAKDDDVVIDL